jgi:small-conductance mechanosensitive channel
MILSKHIINYSTSVPDRGLILNTAVTIGYDVPWRQVHALLISAAAGTPGIQEKPTPFVLQTSLDNYYVSYELNAYTQDPGIMAETYSQLHQNIQDVFTQAGVEIMSPAYSAFRNGNALAIPDNSSPEDEYSEIFKPYDFYDEDTRPITSINSLS